MTTPGWPALTPLVRERRFGVIDRPRLAEHPAFAAASTVAVVGLSLIDPRRLDGAAQTAYRLATAAFTGGYVAATVPVDLPVGTETRAAVGTAAGGLALGLADQFERLDGRVSDWLTQRGVNRPRWVMAGLGAAGALAGYAWDRAEGRRWLSVLEAAGDTEAGMDLRPVAPEVRAVLEALLVDGVPGVEALRRQLDSVREQWQGEGFSPDAWFEVEEDAPRIAPRTQVWPVAGLVQWGGVWFEARLQVHQGRLESLSLTVADDQRGGGPDEATASGLLDRWPRVEELEIAVETPDPVR
ncbi:MULTISPECIES: hypothetical protein [Citricoccus]|uniref:hypothetical protein n=1 Tax=Citricoccus TaxID=169133 RepID=UPI000255EFB6|nr:hypothetical protein [Citricoccus sp. CH26A]